MKKTLIVLVCLFLMLGSAGAALAGQGQSSPTRDGAVEWAFAWLGSLVDEARSALSGLAAVAEIYRADAEGPANAAEPRPLQPAMSSIESGADDGGEDNIPELGPLGEPVG